MTKNSEQSDIVEIDGKRYLVPFVFKDGELVRCIERKLKLPIEITSAFRIQKRSNDEVPKSTFSSLFEGFSNWRKRR